MMMQSEHTKSSANLLTLMLGAMGVVYGDVGTSPLYTMKEIFNGSYAITPTPDNILGILSLIFWSLILVISVKYVLYVMRASNRGEGGIMALMALALRHRNQKQQREIIIILGLLGAALFYGDGIITPAISVLSAVEGLQIAAPMLEPYILPITILLLLLLFAVQSKGTAGVGLLFGPIMVVWFFVLAWLGGQSILQTPEVLIAVNPVYAAHFFYTHGWHAFIALGAVVLAVRGGEVLYADMGHFGKRAIKSAWFMLVLPALLLNYFGQGALILRDTAAIENPFYLLVPASLLYPLIGLSTCATVIASQAVISGIFSMTSQAMQMDYIPRMLRVHTSTAVIGQIYVPTMNRLLFFLVLATVLGFHSSVNLAAAYGLAVTGTMIITTLLTVVVALDDWQWSPKRVYPLIMIFLVIDTAFFSANIIKIPQGGWLPLVIGSLFFLMMFTWRRGRGVLTHYLQKSAMSLTGFIANLDVQPPLARIPGTAVYMSARNLSMPHALQVNYAHNQVLHARIVLLTIITEDVPFLADEQRILVDPLEQGFYRVTARYGFMETPNVPYILDLCEQQGLQIDAQSASFFIGRETLIPSDKPDLNPWQEKIFLLMFRNASSPIQFFKIPTERVVELGVQFEV
jgi:KUP system potassium uptake protein